MRPLARCCCADVLSHLARDVHQLIAAKTANILCCAEWTATGSYSQGVGEMEPGTAQENVEADVLSSPAIQNQGHSGPRPMFRTRCLTRILAGLS